MKNIEILIIKLIKFLTKHQRFGSIDIFNRAESITEPSQDLFDQTKPGSEPSLRNFFEMRRMSSQAESPSQANPLLKTSFF